MNKSLICVIGGMGPLASSEFVYQIYKNHHFDSVEQDAPTILHYSSPSIPDRTTHFLKGNESVVYDALIQVLNKLDKNGVFKYVICCFTIHHLLPKLPNYYKKKIISLVEVIIDELRTQNGSFLFLSTMGTRKMKILQSSNYWCEVKDKVHFLTDKDQVEVHEMIYKYLKLGKKPPDVCHRLEQFTKKYMTDGIVAGCTEIQLVLTDMRKEYSDLKIIDPLEIIARDLPYTN